MSDSFSPIFVGDTGAPFNATFTHDDGTVVDLTGATITLKMLDDLGNIKTGSGTWIIDNAANGLAHYQYAAGDVNTAGVWNLYITITTNSKPVHADVKQLLIEAAP